MSGEQIIKVAIPEGFDVARQKQALWKAGVPERMHGPILTAWVEYLFSEGKAEC